ncbi:MAG: glutathione S-transferase family protein [Cyanobacteria bacterium P01_H01_bin.119]
MKLIGMLDSPYVRRVAISLQLLGLSFEHEPLSVFQTFEAFQQINPVVKAPSLICDDGLVLMDSTLILQYAAAIAPDRSLLPTDPNALKRSLQMIGLALTACEKSIQIVYERQLRPAEKFHQPWISRVTGQLHAAYDGLERSLQAQPLSFAREGITQASITTAVAWYFTQQVVPEVINAENYPGLQAASDVAETLAEFKAAPYGDGVVQFLV